MIGVHWPAKGRVSKRHIEQAVVVRADANLELGRFDEAIADYEAAGAFGTDIGRAYRSRAEQREQAGDADGAAADRERAALLDPLGGGQ